jgi:hypothetical protein
MRSFEQDRVVAVEILKEILADARKGKVSCLGRNNNRLVAIKDTSFLKDIGAHLSVRFEEMPYARQKNALAA